MTNEDHQDIYNQNYTICTGSPFRRLRKKDLVKVKAIGSDKLATDISNRLIIRMKNHECINLDENNVREQIASVLNDLLSEVSL